MYRDRAHVTPADLWRLTKASVSAWMDDSASSMGAALSFYTVFSLTPLLLIVISLAGLIFGADAARHDIVEQLRGLLGDAGAAAVEGLIRSASEPATSTFAAIVGTATLLIGATSVLAELQADLDRIWRVPPATTRLLWTFLRARALSLGVILALAFLLLVSLVVGAALTALGRWWGAIFGDAVLLLRIVMLIVNLAVATLLFAIIYKTLPRASVAWGDVWIGAGVTALLFSAGKWAIGIYLGASAISSSFGAAGSLVVLMVWVYYSAQVFLLGAEFTSIYARRHEGTDPLIRGLRRARSAPALPSSPL